MKNVSHLNPTNMPYRLVLIVFLLLFAYDSSYAQTYFYKRVKIINSGKTTNVNDDAHYITFGKNVCYDSDSKGISGSGLSMRYQSQSNGILSYFGSCYYGSDFHYYVASDKSRINVKRDDVIYVYVRADPKASKATRRKVQQTGNNHPMIISVPSTPIQQTPTQTNTRRECPGCHGTGKGIEKIIWAPNYTGESDYVYCSTCDKVMSRHSHHTEICRVCYGRKYVE